MHPLCWQRTEVGERSCRTVVCFWLLFRGQTLTTTRSWTIERSFQSVLMTLNIRGAARALTYIHSWLVTAIIQRVFFFFFFATAVSWAQREPLWTEVHFKWFVLRVQSRAAIVTRFYIHGETGVASFLPFETNAMEWTYWSIVLLGCIFLDWAPLTSAEEGKSGVFLRMLPRLIFCGCMTWVRCPINIISCSFQKEAHGNLSTCNANDHIEFDLNLRVINREMLIAR